MEPHRRFAAGEAYGRVLEIGAGTGANLPFYDWSNVDALYLTEPDPHMAKRIQRRLDALPGEAEGKVHTVEAPAESLPFADHEFDCAVVTLTLCSVADLSASLQEIRRVLKPEGQMRIVEHIRGGIFTAPVQKLIQPAYGWLSGGCDLSRETEAHIRAAGFSLTVIDRVRFGGPFSPGITGVAHPRTHHAPMPARALQRRRRLLRRGAYLIDRHFRRRWQRYVLQAALAAAVLALVIGIQDNLTNVAIVTAIASSAFIIFMAPHANASSPRRVLGGHFVAIVVGLVIGFIVHDLAAEPYHASLLTDVAAAVGVGVVMLVMAATDTEHPPAAGTVLGLILAPSPLGNGALVVAAAIALTSARTLFQRWLIDLEN